MNPLSFAVSTALPARNAFTQIRFRVFDDDDDDDDDGGRGEGGGQHDGDTGWPKRPFYRGCLERPHGSTTSTVARSLTHVNTDADVIIDISGKMEEEGGRAAQ